MQNSNFLEKVQVSPEDFKKMKAIKLSSESFEKAWTWNSNSLVGLHSNRILTILADKWQEAVGGIGEVGIESIYVDKSKIKKVDTETRLITDVLNLDLLELPMEQMAFGRVIAKLTIKGLDKLIFSSIAVNH